jgi:hypothetical protein
MSLAPTPYEAHMRRYPVLIYPVNTTILGQCITDIVTHRLLQVALFRPQSDTERFRKWFPCAWEELVCRGPGIPSSYPLHYNLGPI